MDEPLSVEARILEILREELGEPGRDIDRAEQLYELLDSLGKVEVLMAIEDEFELQVPDADAEQVKTVGDLIDYIGRHVRGGPPRDQDSAAA